MLYQSHVGSRCSWLLAERSLLHPTQLTMLQHWPCALCNCCLCSWRCSHTRTTHQTQLVGPSCACEAAAL